MAVALGHTSATEPFPGTSLLTSHLKGDIGLLFSPSPPHQIREFFSSYTPADFARAGTTATHTFTLPPGIVYSRGGEISEEEDVPVAHSAEPGLRKLGIPTKLVRGKVVLEGEEGFVVCREGEVLGSGQTTLLKMFGVTMAVFSVRVVAVWKRESGEVKVLEEGGGDEMDVEGA